MANECLQVPSIGDVISLISNVCPRCILRFKGIRYSPAYKDLDKKKSLTDEENDDDEPVSKSFKTNPCIACIGILQNEFMDPALVNVGISIKNGGYDSKNFSVAVSTPAALSLRNHAITLFIKEKIPTFDSDDVVPVKQVWKWLFPQKISADKKAVSGEDSDFFAELQIDYEEGNDEMNTIRKMCQNEYSIREQKSRKFHMGLITRQCLEKSLSQVSDSMFKSNFPVPPHVPSLFTTSVKMYNNNIFIGGRYKKYSRQLPQTPWFVDGERKLITSVEEIILEPLKKCFKFDDSKFYSSGREDVDVRMLGSGRPFAFEIVNPRKTMFTEEELLQIENSINSSSTATQVSNLRFIKKNDVEDLKKNEEQRSKDYVCVIVIPKSFNWTPESLNDRLKNEVGEKVVLKQWTPIRVLHRRSNASRTRAVYNMKFEAISLDKEYSESRFAFHLTTEAGTYVKEFVHGDFGRTTPNLSIILGCPVDIEALDVKSINMEWPPR